MHAVGPVYRVNPLKDGISPDTPEAAAHMAAKDHLLTSAYAASLGLARDHGVKNKAKQANKKERRKKKQREEPVKN